MKLNINELDRKKDEYIILDDVENIKLYADQLDIYDKREVKLLLLFDKNLDSRKNLEINVIKNENEIELYDNTTLILKKTIKDGSITIDNNEKNKIEDLLEFRDKTGRKILKVIDNEYKEQFKLYYNQLLNKFKYNEKPKSSSKYSAMMTYLALKDKYSNIAPPNSFIKNNKLEFDMILLKDECKDKYKYVYDKEEVKAVFELKTAGVMYPSESFKIGVLKNIIYNYISNYVEFKKNNYDWKDKIKKETTDKKYDELMDELFVKLKDNEKNIEDKIPPFIYFTLHESDRPIKGRNNKSRVDLFKEVIDDYNKRKKSIENLPDFYYVFCSSKKDNEKFIMYKEKTLEEILKDIN